jgi:predicted nucleotidyltransferase component of viral defense system
LTQDELVVDEIDYRGISHLYQDAPESSPKICCYSVNEILAEKTRALYEREGRARDIYDIVHANSSPSGFSGSVVGSG